MRSSAKDVFLYLLMIIMLAVGVIFFTTLLWQYINIQLPDQLEYYYPSAVSLMRGAISALIIVWPVLLLSTWMINRDLKSEAEKSSMWIRKWLLYLTLFVSSLTIIIDLITLINSYLNGEFTIRFLLKVLVVLVVAACVFAFYLWELRRDVAQKTQVHKMVAIASSVLVIFWVCLGFVEVGSPVHQRAIRFDEQRVYDLQAIQSEVIYYWDQKEVLPADLAMIDTSSYSFVAPSDPVTLLPYSYTVTGELSFELCATFETDTATATDSWSTPRGVYEQNSNWNHSEGLTCFDRVIDPDFYDTNAIKM